MIQAKAIKQAGLEVPHSVQAKMAKIPPNVQAKMVKIPPNVMKGSNVNLTSDQIT